MKEIKVFAACHASMQPAGGRTAVLKWICLMVSQTMPMEAEITLSTKMPYTQAKRWQPLQLHGRLLMRQTMPMETELAQGAKPLPDVEVDDRVIQKLRRVEAFQIPSSNFHRPNSPVWRVQRLQSLRRNRNVSNYTVLACVSQMPGPRCPSACCT